jgi:hypothetical protein
LTADSATLESPGLPILGHLVLDRTAPAAALLVRRDDATASDPIQNHRDRASPLYLLNSVLLI